MRNFLFCRNLLRTTVLLRINDGGVHLIFDILFFLGGGGGGGGRLFKGGVYTR